MREAALGVPDVPGTFWALGVKLAELPPTCAAFQCEGRQTMHT